MKEDIVYSLIISSASSHIISYIVSPRTCRAPCRKNYSSVFILCNGILKLYAPPPSKILKWFPGMTHHIGWVSEKSDVSRPRILEIYMKKITIFGDISVNTWAGGLKFGNIGVSYDSHWPGDRFTVETRWGPFFSFFLIQKVQTNRNNYKWT